jgi:acyl-coenzyme A thioesterase PaaI-like protein
MMVASHHGVGVDAIIGSSAIAVTRFSLADEVALVIVSSWTGDSIGCSFNKATASLRIRFRRNASTTTDSVVGGRVRSRHSLQCH